MARPNRQGVDYFPLDVHLDDKFKFVEIKYKLEGFGIVIKLLQKIYSYGYWYRWTEDEILILSDELRVNYELVKNVVDECLARGVFDSDMYEKYNILTSKGIQKRYKEMVRRRKDVEVTEDYLLIDDIMPTPSKHNDDTVTTSSKQNDSKSTQSKEKVNRKESKKKDKYLEFVRLTKDEYSKLIDKFGQSKADEYIERLNDYIGSKGDKYRSHYHTILNWSKKDNVVPPKQEKKLTQEEKQLNATKNRITELEGKIKRGYQYYEDHSMDHLYSKHQEELKELYERLRTHKETG